MKYKATYKIMGQNYNSKEQEITELTQNVEIEFHCNPEDYGNGYYMKVSGKAEPFGFSLYDIRYDIDFDPNNKILYIVQFYTGRYDGKDGSWELRAISVEVVE